MHAEHSPEPPILKLESVEQRYRSGERELVVLHAVDLAIARGEAVAIVGPSGSGKTTLLGLCAGLDSPTAGRIFLAGQPLHALDEEARAALRNARIGFVFQNFQLIPTLTALENVCIPLELRGVRQAASQARDWLARVGLAERAHHYPVQLSGGEQQRVAIARACIGDPEILFADEPTGNLDADTSGQIEDLIIEAHRRRGNTLVMVTHNAELAARADRIIRIHGGRIDTSR
jgi:putative ABC transport system ATP-binding protein